MKKFAPIFCGFCLAFLFQATALAQPIITNQPQSITVNNASDATFTVGASNALTYQWQFDGTNLSDGGNITGSTNSALTLEDVTSNEAGSYTVILNGSVTSSNAVLTIVPGTVVTFIFTNFIGGGASNVAVQLFDHDKPATVQNFLHYVRSGAYTNMFFERCLPGFIIQGGDYGATDQTNTSPPMTGWDIAGMFTMATNQNPPFPAQVDSEFNVGPLIHNSFGTMAMALFPNNSNSAASAFFFNLTNNSANLDFQTGGFTVFGRILDGTGTNVLQYFNTLTEGGGTVTNGEFLDDVSMTTNLTITNLPVNYLGTNAPANANLVFCGFQLPTNAPVDTNPPSALIISPAPNAVLTNGNPVIQGTASDDVGLAVVICTLIPQPAPDGTYPNEGLAITNYAVGTTNWSVTFSNSDDPSGQIVPPGSYELSVQSQDGAGNLSLADVQPLTITAIVINGDGSVSLTNGAFTNLNAVGYPFQNGSNYNLVATPGPNQVFVSWTIGDSTAVDTNVLISMSDGFLLTATFITNGLPDSMAFTYPLPDSTISTNAFDITGTISNVPSPPATVICRIYSTTTFTEVGSPLTNSDVTSNWSVSVSNLPADSYSVEATAVDSASNSTVITEDFTNDVTLQLNIVGPGTVSGATNGEPMSVGSTFQVTANPNPGQLFESWSNSLTGEVSLDPVQTYTAAAGLALTATFISNNFPGSIAFTSPPTNSLIGPNFLISGIVSNMTSPPVTVTCQIFSDFIAISFNRPLQETNVTSTWSIPVSGLNAGSYTVVATAVDAAGNSTLISENFTVATSFPLQLNIVGPGTVSGATNGEYFAYGSTFQVTAIPNPGQLFYTWSNSVTGAVSLNPVQTYTMGAGLALTATFVTNSFPNMIAFTSPLPNGIVGLNTLFIAGTVSSNILSTPVTVTCQLFSTNSLALSQLLKPPVVTNHWSIDLSGVGAGTYILVATASDPAGDSTLISESFTAAADADLQLIIVGDGTVAPFTNGESLPIGTNFLIKATPAAGWAFFTWNNGSGTFYDTNQIFTMASGLTLTATFIPTNTVKGISFTYPAANAVLSTNSFSLKGTVASSFKPADITCQIYSTNTGMAVGSPLTTSGTTTWSIPVTNLPGGDYLVQAVATNAAGKRTIISEQFFVLPFIGVAGTYSGLFISTNSPVAPTNSGFLTFTVESSGLFSGKLLFPAYPAVPIYPTFFENIEFTTGYFPFSFTNFYGQPLNGAIYLDLTGGTNVALGTISSTAWSSPLICYRAVTALSTNTTPATGKYILSLDPTNWPNSNGYATLAIGNKGVLTLSGVLPDDATFSESVGVSKDGIWPLYAVPSGYKTNGMLMGWETNSASNNCGGQLYWCKAPHIGTYDTNGVDTNVNSTGTNYLAPAEGAYSIVFQGGTIDVPLTNELTVARAGGPFVVPTHPVPADKLAIALSTSGVLTGHFVNPNGDKTLDFTGAFFGQSQGGSGFVLEGDGQTGFFTLEIEPP